VITDKFSMIILSVIPLPWTRATLDVLGCTPEIMFDVVDVVVIVLVEVVAAVDNLVMTVGIVASEVVNVGIPGNEPEVTLTLGFRVDRNFFEASLHEDAAAPEIVSSDRFGASNNQRRSVSHDKHRRRSPLLMYIVLSLRRCGQGPLGNPSQTGMAMHMR